MPQIRPFRALRYSPEAIPDLTSVMAPPYDVIGPAQFGRLLARDRRNIVRLDLPIEVAGEDPDERYRRAARTLATWRSDGTLRQDPRPAVYVYDQAYTVPGTGIERSRRGFFARVRIEAFGPDSGIRAHERTLAGPKEDRYRLLRATSVNTSPIVGLYEEPSGRAADILEAVSRTTPTMDLVDDDGIRHRLWVVAAAPAGEDGSVATDDPVAALCTLAGASSVTIADGHHRYETALRFRDERRVGAPVDADPSYDQVLMLLLEPGAGALTVLPTHRILLDLDAAAIASLRAALPALFEVTEGVGRDELVRTFSPAGGAPGGEGRFGLWADGVGAVLRARRAAFEAILPAGGPALRRLDVSLLGAALEHAGGLGEEAIAAGGRIIYTKDAAEAIEAVDQGREGAALAFLLDPTPPSEISAVAADGDVMPQKSTYIYPKALTGLVLNPLES